MPPPDLPPKEDALPKNLVPCPFDELGEADITCVRGRIRDEVRQSAESIRASIARGATPTPLYEGTISLVSNPDEITFVRWTLPVTKMARRIRLDDLNRIICIVPYCTSNVSWDTATILIYDVGVQMAKTPPRTDMPKWCLEVYEAADAARNPGPHLGLNFACVVCTRSQEAGASHLDSIDRLPLFRCCGCLKCFHKPCLRLFSTGGETSDFHFCPLCSAR